EANPSNQSFTFGAEGEAKIPATAIIKKVVCFWYCKPSATANKLLIKHPTSTKPEFTEEILISELPAGENETTAHWRTHEVKATNIEKLVASDLREPNFRVGISSAKATLCRLNVVYI